MSVSHQLDERARSAFREHFGHAPGAVATAPGRINIVGEHTDYNLGFVLPAAINRHVGVALRLRKDAQISIRSDRYPMPIDLPELPARRQGSWGDYVLGVADQLRRRAGEGSGFEAAVVSDVPTGSGLSSSGALEVAVAVTLLAERHIDLTPLEIAQLCQAAENQFVGSRTGVMDQFTALQARAGNALLLDCRSLQYDYVPLPGAEYAWLLADTRVHHQLAASAYNQRRAECEGAARALGARSLREISEDDLERIANPVERRRARHVVSENARVVQAADILRRRSTEGLGPILFASHASLRDDFEVSCAELDCLVELAAEVPDVIGARMMGGGFGGCALILTKATGLDEVEQHLAEGYARAFSRSPEFYRVRSADGVMPQVAA
ncbi:MAG TPA: galactokinase [Candidatus Dormibacteraeota bacterium]|jgi:galactokinase|nr:galactokinase [Candidatus Dormibacteraeota bacterium]